MMPGSACRSCDAVGGKASGKSWDISGTVYATAHEPDDCNGSSASGVTVVITDKNGGVTTLPVNSVGNFWHNDLLGFAAIPKLYTAKVVSGGKTREMIGAQTDGDCNKCHTESGTSLAPGRIMFPCYVGDLRSPSALSRELSGISANCAHEAGCATQRILKHLTRKVTARS